LRDCCDYRGRTLLPAADTDRVLHWSNYSAKAIALIQARGMPIDVPLWNLVQENKIAVIGELLRRFDPSYGSDDPIYTPEGEWSYTRSGIGDYNRREAPENEIRVIAARSRYFSSAITFSERNQR
jgi:hypothetical protein